jgi:hypothetical protein
MLCQQCRRFRHASPHDRVGPIEPQSAMYYQQLTV